jgi:hypothetical protein
MGNLDVARGGLGGGVGGTEMGSCDQLFPANFRFFGLLPSLETVPGDSRMRGPRFMLRVPLIRPSGTFSHGGEKANH